MDIKEQISKYEFYHIIDLGNGIKTPGYSELLPPQQMIRAANSSLDFKGKRVLDIGCRDGLFCFEAEKAGAEEIVGVDNMISKGAVECLIPYLHSKVTMHEMSLFDLTPSALGLFDIVIFPGVLYHLRYPFSALKIIRDMLKPGGKLILETAVMRSWKTSKLEKLPLLFCPVEDESPYEPTSVTFFNTKGMVDSLKTLNFKTDKVSYLFDDLEKQKMPPKKRIMHSLSFAWKKYFIDRGTFICTATDNDHEGVSNYWNKVYSAEDIANLRTPKK